VCTGHLRTLAATMNKATFWARAQNVASHLQLLLSVVHGVRVLQRLTCGGA